MEELQKKLPTLQKSITNTQKELEEARNKVIDFSSIKTKLTTSEGAVKNANRDVEDAKNALKELRNSAKKIGSLQEKEKEARDNFYKLEALRQQLDKNLNEKLMEIEKKTMKIRESEELATDARILWRKSINIKKIEELNEKINRINDIDRKIEIQRKQERFIFPTNDEIEEIIQNQIQIDRLNENLKAQGLAVNINPGEDGSLKVEIDGNKINNGKLNITGTECVSIEAPGLGKVTVRARLIQARDAKHEIDRLKKIISQALHKYDINSIEELKELNRTQNGIKQKIKELDAERRGIDERKINEITIELEKLNKKLVEYEKIERTPLSIKLNPVDVDFGMLINKREKGEADARETADKARAERDIINKELKEKIEEFALAQANKRRFSDDLEDARTQEREIIRKYGSVENQEKILRTAKENHDNKMMQYENIKQQYEELENGPINRITRLEKQRESQDQVIQQQRTLIDQLKGNINITSLNGAYSKLSETESKIEIYNERLEKEEIRAESYKLLKETLKQQYLLVISSVVEPIMDEVKKSLIYVTGSLHEDVKLNEYLVPIKLRERGFNDDTLLDFGDGSSGLKELLALCVRLAVAKHLSGTDNQCLVLDDPFVHVSSDRSNKMIELINEAIKEWGLQIIVLTHREMELSGFGGKMVDIQSVKMDSIE